jgi:hypothetical protein
MNSEQNLLVQQKHYWLSKNKQTNKQTNKMAITKQAFFFLMLP